MDRRRKALIQVGFKSLELVDEGIGNRLRFGLVERGRGFRREVRVSEIELLWLCLILEDASSGLDKDFARSYGGFARRLMVRRFVHAGGFCLRLEVRDVGRVWFVSIPELSGPGGWVDISRKFWAFCGWKRSGRQVDGRSFLEVAKIGGWPVNTVRLKERRCRRRGCDVEVQVESTQSILSFLGKSLVGKLENGALVLPTAMEVHRWAQRNWKVSAGIQVFDLGGDSFLFSFPSIEEAQRIRKGSWSFGGRRWELDWWSPVGSCVKQGEAATEVWVRILGLPLHLWDFEVFREIGDICGKFLDVDDETRQRSHLRWARIAVRAVPSKIPSTVKVAMGGWVFDVPLWVEKGPTVVFRPDLEVGTGGDGDSGGASVGGEIGRRKETTRDGSLRGARGGLVVYGSGRFTKSENRVVKGFGPGHLGQGLGRDRGPVWRGRNMGQRSLKMGLRLGALGNLKTAQPFYNKLKNGPGDKRACLFKRPVRSNLVALKNKKWVQKSDSGGGTSYGRAEALEGESSGLIGAECNFRQSSELGCPVEVGIKFKTIPDCSEVLPVMIDVGTNNEKLLKDPLYLGLQEPRLDGEEYVEVVDEFMEAVFTRWPNVIVQFEDFQSKWAFKLLQRYRNIYRMFNDDVQGTAGVAIAGLLGAVRAQGKPLIDFPKMKIVVAGAGSAGIGVLNAARKTMARMLGNNEYAFESARSQFWVVDAKGLITEERENIDPDALPFARKVKEIGRQGLMEGASLEEVVRQVKPDVLLGLSAVGGLFSKEVLEALKCSTSTRPAIFAMSNPTKNAECTPEEAFSVLGENIIFASGSPFKDVDLGNGHIGHCNQGNNMYLFPGIGLGTLLSGSRIISDGMLQAAAERLAEYMTEEEVLKGIIFPPISRIRDITKEVAAAVVKEAIEEDLAEGYREMDARELRKLNQEEIETYVQNNMWSPEYPTLVYKKD